MSCSTTAQYSKTDYSTENKKAIKLYEEALAALDARKYDEAAALLTQAVGKDENFTDAHLVLGEVNLQLGNTAEAKENLETATRIEPRKFMAAYFYLGGIYISEMDYETAKKNLLIYTQNNPKESPMTSRAQLALRSCDFAISALKNPVDFQPINMGPKVNTPFPEYYPTLTVDEEELLFTRRIENSQAFQGVHEDFYVAKNGTDGYGQAANLRNVNTLMNEGAPSYSASGNLLFFTACDLFGDYGGGRTGLGSCDIFYAFKNGDQWSDAVNLGGQINSGVWETQPSFSADGRTLYFIRGKRVGNGIGQQDIWFSELNDEGLWSKAKKIPGSVNTPYTEESVFIHPDGQTLYFASDGHPGMGGLDLFLSKKNPDGSWGEPVNLGYPINTEKDENSLLVSSSGQLALFASDREGGYGDLDLYHFNLPESARPEPVTYAKGRVYDDRTLRPLGSDFEIINLSTSQRMATGTSDSKNGTFLMPLPTGNEYMVNVSKKDYMFYSKNFKLTDADIAEPFSLNIPLKRIESGNAVVLENVFFDSDSYALKENSKIELGKLVSFLNLNPELDIEIGGHTDDVGNDADNLSLSKNRAESVKGFLIESGIEADRVNAVGYGETSPLESNDTAAGKAINRRTEFKIN